jgi:hypothetical protein
LNLLTFTLPRPGRCGLPWEWFAAELLPPAPPGMGELLLGLRALCTASSMSAASRTSIDLSVGSLYVNSPLSIVESAQQSPQKRALQGKRAAGNNSNLLVEGDADTLCRRQH